MDKAGLVRKISDLLKENNIKRPVSIPKQVFTFSDNEGHYKNFVVKKNDRREIYTIYDIENIIEAALEVMKNEIKHGGEIYIRDFA